MLLTLEVHTWKAESNTPAIQNLQGAEKWRPYLTGTSGKTLHEHSWSFSAVRAQQNRLILNIWVLTYWLSSSVDNPFANIAKNQGLFSKPVNSQQVEEKKETKAELNEGKTE